MRIGVLSDIHDNMWALAEVLPRLNGCQALLVLGDLCAPFTISDIAEGFRGPVHAVWGNNDGDKLQITRNADKAGNVTLHGNVAEVRFGGRRVAFAHYPDVAQAMAQGGIYDLVCHGHDHTRKITRMGNTILLNPGEVMGRFGPRSYAVYDTESGEAEIIEF
ncbi:MAG: hypothetical protein A2Y73_08015 [Chloroflexi bacterium RBG_13_56_8]|nr:MAG: hypothetical protein A2Y73_08015 [Chloroflexi bacterium RBG_13_56_8]